MPFRAEQVRLERFSAEAHYHSAFNFFSLKGALAERWAHGPVFGAYTEVGNQVNLTPEPGSDALILGSYGLKVSALNYEKVRDEEKAYDLASSWLADVFDVLRPKRTVRLVTQWFSLYPLGEAASAQAASKKLRDRYYRPSELESTLPDGFDAYHTAVDTILLRGNTHLSFIIGAVGPPHRGTFFLNGDSERDGRWWMGVRTNHVRVREDGIENPTDVLEELLEAGSRHHGAVTRTALTGIV